MASGGHLLAQQKHSVEARIKGLLNADLKEICKAYGAAVSGTKVVLQKRCIQGECIWWCCEGGAERSQVWGSASAKVGRRDEPLPRCALHSTCATERNDGWTVRTIFY